MRLRPREMKRRMRGANACPAASSTSTNRPGCATCAGVNSASLESLDYRLTVEKHAGETAGEDAAASPAASSTSTDARVQRRLCAHTDRLWACRQMVCFALLLRSMMYCKRPRPAVDQGSCSNSTSEPALRDRVQAVLWARIELNDTGETFNIRHAEGPGTSSTLVVVHSTD